LPKKQEKYVDQTYVAIEIVKVLCAWKVQNKKVSTFDKVNAHAFIQEQLLLDSQTNEIFHGDITTTYLVSVTKVNMKVSTS
jgi:hypothetical protein